MADAGRRFSIGRDSSCDVVLADDTVSRRHASLEILPQGPMILSAESPDAHVDVIHRGEARAIRKGIVTVDDVLRFGDVEIPVSEVLVAIRLRDVRSDDPLNKTPPPVSQPRPEPRERGVLAKPPAAPGPPAAKMPGVAKNARPVTRSLVLRCPACGTPTTSLKRHRLYNWLVFIVVAYWAQTAEYTACPPCMRKVILTRTLVNIPTANLTWPILFVIHAVHFAGTFRTGHSRKVRELMT